MIKRALISVSDKTGVVAFARFLADRNIEILATGGTAKMLAEHKIPIIEVAAHTNFPEMLGGRVKTLHPKIHGGILARRGMDDETLKAHEILPIDLVVVNLYPFAEVIKNPGCRFEDAIENIDIGGPALVRSAAKNHRFVTVLVDAEDYGAVLKILEKSADTTPEMRLKLAQKAFLHTAEYDAKIADYLDADEILRWRFKKAQTLRYGENPHQAAAFYRSDDDVEIKQHQGREISYNNLLDADTAVESVRDFATPACAIIKHQNPCGVALADKISTAYQNAFATDPTSAFGGIVAFNRKLDEKTAAAILKRQFVEVVIAPEIDKNALAKFGEKPDIRILTYQNLPASDWDYRRVFGGLLWQQKDRQKITRENLQSVGKIHPDEATFADLLFAWQVVKMVKSNAIVYAKNRMTIGIGAGQTARVDAAKIASMKAADANLSTKGAVMASDAFLPFRDSVDVAARAGISAIIQPGGSLRDAEVITAANEHKIAMVLTGIRHFRH